MRPSPADLMPPVIVRAVALLALSWATTVADAQLTMVLTELPAGTPAGAQVHVAGSFNGWDPGAGEYVLTVRADGSRAITLPPTVRGTIEFKFTLGSWEVVETAADGTGIPNRTVTIPPSGAATFTGTIAGWRSADEKEEPRRPTITASVSVLSDSFPLPQLGVFRRVWLYLPPDYASSTKRYPVIYMHDGQNVFDAATSFAGEWGVDEALDSLHALGDWGAIVVAVDHGGARRLDEYNPWRAPEPRWGGGAGDEYVDFIARTLKPFIDRYYRTRPGAEQTAIIGSSAGGLISLYATLRYPQLFGRAGVFSCACWLARPHIFDFAQQSTPAAPVPRFYFVAGALETPDGQLVHDQRSMVATLTAAGWLRPLQLTALVREDGTHSEWFWRREFVAAYQWLLAGAHGSELPR